MPLTQLTVSLSSTYYVHDEQDGYVRPGDDNSLWWTAYILGSEDQILLDPGQFIGVRSQETVTVFDPFVVTAHPNFGELSLNVLRSRPRDIDSSDYYYFTITNLGNDSVALMAGDVFAHVTHYDG